MMRELLAPELLVRIRDLTAEVLPEIISVRHAVHSHPELAFAEHRTASLVSSCLTRYGIPHRTGVAETGIVALIGADAAATSSSKVVGVRADMDCLPIEEKTGLPYASRVPGQSHVCGHDLHTSVLIGVGYVMRGLRDALPGVAKLIFQPAEETLEGAKRMIEEGVLRDPELDCAVSFHTSPELRPGVIGYLEGASMASKDDFEIEIIGRPGHAAHPHLSVDCVLAASQFVTQIQAVVSREIAPSIPAVISVFALNAGPVLNTLPASATLQGSIRTTNAAARQHCIAAVRRYLEGLKLSHRIDYRLQFVEKAPVLQNAPETLGILVRAAREAVGAEQVVRMPGPSMGSEDFAYFAEKVPSGHLRIGVCGAPDFAPVHNPKFIAADEAIGPAIQAVSAGVIALMQTNSSEGMYS